MTVPQPFQYQGSKRALARSFAIDVTYLAFKRRLKDAFAKAQREGKVEKQTEMI